jgi:hypothetical protein
MTSEAGGAVCAVESMRLQWKQFVEDFCGRKGCLRCRIHASPMEALLVMISEAGGAVYAVESMLNQGKQFR